MRKKTKREHDLIKAAQSGDLTAVRRLKDIGNAPAFDSEALRQAAKHGHTRIVRLLIPLSNPTDKDSEALQNAAQHGHNDTVRYLLPVSDPSANDSMALYYAARNGNTELVRLLLPASDPNASDGRPLRQAAERGHVDVVRLLAPATSANADAFSNRSALRVAAHNGHLECVRVLVEHGHTPFSGVNDALFMAADQEQHDVVAYLVSTDPIAAAEDITVWLGSSSHPRHTPAAIRVINACSTLWSVEQLNKFLKVSGPHSGLDLACPVIGALELRHHIEQEIVARPPSIKPSSFKM